MMEEARALHAYRALVAEELLTPVAPRVIAMANGIRARFGAAARAVLFYGSCLRKTHADGLMLDFYVIVSDYRQAYGRGWQALANRLLPPSVFPYEQDGLSAKYAVLSEADFITMTGPSAGDVSVIARFAQPSRLVWAADDAAGERVMNAISQCAPTLFEWVLPTLAAGAEFSGLDIWRQTLALTYATELRAERAGRGAAIVEADPPRFERFATAALALLAERRAADLASTAANAVSFDRAVSRWRHFRRRGKLLSLLRLIKASTTFAGGIDYLAWKINRHAGTTIAIRPWQRRYPIAGALTLLPRLLRYGAVR